MHRINLITARFINGWMAVKADLAANRLSLWQVRQIGIITPAAGSILVERIHSSTSFAHRPGLNAIA